MCASEPGESSHFVGAERGSAWGRPGRITNYFFGALVLISNLHMRQPQQHALHAALVAALVSASRLPCLCIAFLSTYSSDTSHALQARRPTSPSHLPLPSAPTDTWTRLSLKSRSPPCPPSAPQSSCSRPSTTSFRHRPNHTMWASWNPARADALAPLRWSIGRAKHRIGPSRRCACPLSRTPRKRRNGGPLLQPVQPRCH